MIKEIETIINKHKRVLFIGEKQLGKSHTVRLLLSSSLIQNKVIVETKQEVEFIKRNLLIDSSITFKSYQSYSGFPKIISNLNQKGLPFISVTNDLSLFSNSTENSLYAISQKDLSTFLKTNFDLIALFENKYSIKYFQLNKESKNLAI
ncbi:hypothetical protein [Alkalihalobacillus sp. BA299]|uniref:hypothetical protein n=1 Tax=Alkalihalobacillus sp. BA299 TaxID=2815938 RepID=UPI001AD9C483|nr:hypothetical protein [Alkalihalobacillus sp. BA299]